MRTLPLILLATCSAAPAIRPVEEARDLRYSNTTEVFTVADADRWEAFVARQSTEAALRLRTLSIDFARQTFVFACVMVTSGSTRVEFDAAFEGGVLAVRARTRTPKGPVTTDIAFRGYAAVVEQPGVEAVLSVDGVRDGGGR